jgi:adenine-specific DNA methylase
MQENREKFSHPDIFYSNEIFSKTFTKHAQDHFQPFWKLFLEKILKQLEIADKTRHYNLYVF